MLAEKLTDLSPESTKLRARFWAKVAKSGADDCWEWQAAKTYEGYGLFTMSGNVGAHRVAWMLFTGEDIPDGMLICHHCDNPSCVNPRHLFLGTTSDNIRDSLEKGRWPSPCGLCEDDVREIRRLYKETDILQREIADLFGIAAMTVSRIVRYRAWAHVS